MKGGKFVDRHNPHALEMETKRFFHRVLKLIPKQPPLMSLKVTLFYYQEI